MLFSNKCIRRKWTKEEDIKLVECIKINGTNWQAVSNDMIDRNPSQCAQRWKRAKPDSVSVLNYIVVEKQKSMECQRR